MKKNLVLIWILTLIHAMYFNIAYALEFDAIVAKDGSGNYLTIQEAINAAPSNSTVPFIIFIKNGEYNEKLYFQKSFITLIGEDRDSTIIVTAELRRVWRETNPGDWGVATINIENGITDLTFANLTIKNNFAEVYPDFPDNNDHTMAIRGGGHRIILINCTVVAAGGDTVSLWNTDGGMFYHNRCYFEGYVDYVCPRGYCYISDCDFYGYNGNASIWHDGSGGKDHKLVIKKSNFDGISSFGLGRFHRMSAFYLLDCDFSNNMRNNDITYVGDSLSSDRDKLIYGRRVYYYNCHREEYDYFWHENNLEKAEGSPYPDSINALWTFNNQWNPEAKIEGLLPFAFLPSPANETRNIELQPVLTW
ncbi:MAG: hypothetical protein JXB17_07840, partial [Bacteroidales bacterium]|nr:hypothetical protein [Bacteroidales bacterium]